MGIRTVRTCLLIFLAAVMSLGISASASERHVIKKIAISGDYGWDYLTADTTGRRLYVSHDKEVVVLDLDSGATIGRIPGSDVHGIAVVHDLNRGFISASDPGSAIVFDLKTLAVVGKITVGGDPNAIFYDPYTKHVFTMDRGSKRVSAIDPATLKVVGTVENLGGKTEHAVSDEAGHIFLNMQDLGTTLRIDAKAMKVTDTWHDAPCEQPSSMDMDRRTHRVFIGCRSGAMLVLDAETGRIVTMQPIGKGVDATEFDPERGLVYFSTGGDGALWVFHEDTPEKFSLVETVVTQSGARTTAVDGKTGNAYLSVAEYGPRPAAEPGKPQPRPPMVPGTFGVLVVGK
jgi:YVTN family beta-propeller protein